MRHDPYGVVARPETLIFALLTAFASACDSGPLPEIQPVTSQNRAAPLICNAPRSKTEPILFAFETDDRGKCEVHGTVLFRAQVPVDISYGLVAPVWSCLVTAGPHGRIAAYAGEATRAAGTYVTVNRCEECVKATEKYWRSSRGKIESHVTNQWSANSKP